MFNTGVIRPLHPWAMLQMKRGILFESHHHSSSEHTLQLGLLSFAPGGRHCRCLPQAPGTHLLPDGGSKASVSSCRLPGAWIGNPVPRGYVSGLQTDSPGARDLWGGRGVSPGASVPSWWAGQETGLSNCSPRFLKNLM